MKTKEGEKFSREERGEGCHGRKKKRNSACGSCREKEGEGEAGERGKEKGLAARLSRGERKMARSLGEISERKVTALYSLEEKRKDWLYLWTQRGRKGGPKPVGREGRGDDEAGPGLLFYESI